MSWFCNDLITTGLHIIECQTQDTGQCKWVSCAPQCSDFLVSEQSKETHTKECCLHIKEGKNFSDSESERRGILTY